MYNVHVSSSKYNEADVKHDDKKALLNIFCVFHACPKQQFAFTMSLLEILIAILLLQWIT